MTKPALALILDTETTGFEPPPIHCAIEVACQLFDLRLGIPLASYASLICSPSNAAESVNRIPVAALALLHAPAPTVVWSAVETMMHRADVVLAHRADFDRSFVPPHLSELRPWICSKFHIDWPLGKNGDHLTHLALAHGLGILSAHRAMADVDTLSRILSRVHEMGYSLPDIVARAMRPRVKVIALTSYDEREVTKAHGFTWTPETKTWSREMFEDEVSQLPFRTRLA